MTITNNNSLAKSHLKNLSRSGIDRSKTNVAKYISASLEQVTLESVRLNHERKMVKSPIIYAISAKAAHSFQKDACVFHNSRDLNELLGIPGHGKPVKPSTPQQPVKDDRALYDTFHGTSWLMIDVEDCEIGLERPGRPPGRLPMTNMDGSYSDFRYSIIISSHEFHGSSMAESFTDLLVQ